MEVIITFAPQTMKMTFVERLVQNQKAKLQVSCKINVDSY